MIPKEKAEELVLKYLRIKDNWNKDGWFHKGLAKQCALIAVNNIIAANPHSNPFNSVLESTMTYWEEVKQEIEKL
jgi:hypothetical protein